MMIKVLLMMTLISSTLFGAIGLVTALKGESELLRQTSAIPVVKGLDIEEKDLLRTKAASKVQVVLADDTVITIGPQSEYRFERFQEGSDPEVLMQIDRGFFKTVTGKIGKVAPQRFKIRTRAATIGIRGTQFMAYVSDEEEKIGCIQGRIIVWTAEGEFIVSAGEMIYYKERHWHRQVIDIKSFEPVMIGISSEKEHRYTQGLFLPQFQDSYVLEEQILKDLQAQEPFDFVLDFDATQQPPTFNP